MLKALCVNRVVFASIIRNVVLLLFLVFSCLLFNTNVLVSEELQKKTAEQYYLDGIYHYVDRNYITAVEQFEALTKNYPYSQYTRNSLVLEVFLNFLRQEYKANQSIAEIFLKLFPDDEYVPYIMYMNAMSYYICIKDDNRGFDNVTKSLKIFNDLLVRYPNSKYSHNVKEKIDFLNKKIHLIDVSTAEYYQKNGDYIGALKRYTGILNSKKDISPDIEERALCGVISILYSFDMDKEVLKYKKLLKVKHPYSKCLMIYNNYTK